MRVGRVRKHCLAVVLAILSVSGVWASDAVPSINSIGMSFVRVPAGEFLMGSDESPEEIGRAHV